MITETQVFMAVKNYLLQRGWSVIAGQPPSGTDNLPVVEIRDSGFRGKGSKGSYKPDLIAWADFKLFVIELKPNYSQKDREKVSGVLHSRDRVSSLWEGLIQRNIEIKGVGPIKNLESKSVVVGGLGYGGTRVNHPELWRFFVDGESVEVTPGTFSVGKEHKE